MAKIKTNDERVSDVRNLLNRFLADPQRYHCHQVTDKEEILLAAYVLDQQTSSIEVPLFRVCDKKRLSTLTRALLTGIVRQAAQTDCKSVLVKDPCTQRRDLTDLGFIETAQGFLKPVLCGWVSSEKAVNDLNQQGIDFTKMTEMSIEALRDEALAASQLEHLVWPAKISDANLPCFIVPIQPRFAEHLFDGRLAAGNLFGADVDLALNPESAYYRSARTSVITAPARVLWYVSQDDQYEGTKSIRAASRVVEVVTAFAKELFTRFRRLGVYEWSDVLETAGNDLAKPIMAFRFDDTELIAPVSWERFQGILEANGISNNFIRSPVAIPPSVFGQIYSAGLDPSTARRYDLSREENR